MDKKVLSFIFKVLVYALTTAATVFGLGSLTSCTVGRTANASGHTIVVSHDSTVIDHNGNYQIKF